MTLYFHCCHSANLPLGFPLKKILFFLADLLMLFVIVFEIRFEDFFYFDEIAFYLKYDSVNPSLYNL
jgi:hypothetical protein